ncbi:DUF5691 domain-containing protein [Paenarthrobacter aurescens]|uniref:Uncharacterized protein n=1 Tax=Paenarthrobacter aurescens TaxID=43663 RepID=A0A4Y3NAI9_PAEAU|nr:DUF5691 domain-containing protein [Paenarthrobacter aurescens]MDO6143465.1 DUF5691 domain-containing protein [Paenarthrobacter aurescens]MDO6147313.1 DUF5691 domain-containing protein [Paenarthrobacter aurescens]MDO6158557.1 DUF5691 domain-containing protein [Paenarthrobacter aurescens]MDO6162540.1 DUF5691 domain-containing protein [Paenarthrobacter aurescens]GEB18283.1 hypothetical protein AAU01_10380 [Paenarthrobacter aurescens]
MMWVADLRTAALVGTGRHDAPHPPTELGFRAPAGLSREESLLDQAALADIVTRATRTATTAPQTGPSSPAPADVEPQASGEAARLLDLLLTQPPVGLELRTQLVVDWLGLAEKSRRRVPHRLLPALLTLAETNSAVFRSLEPAIGTRGRWLQEIKNPPSHEPATQSTGPRSSDAAADYGRLRGGDPSAARAQLRQTWTSLSARERAGKLALFAGNLQDDDEALLEQALDDKAKGVRDVALRLLDQLPESARAARMATRLKPLLQVKGLLSKRLEIDLPPAPDKEALRDGVPPDPRKGEPDRMARLEAIIKGAPLDVWTAATGRNRSATLALLQGEPRILDAMIAATAARNDPEWARALLGVVTDRRLLDCLPPDERAHWLERHVRETNDQPLTLAPLLHDLPQPWPVPLSEAVLAVISGKDGGRLAALLAAVLPTALPPEAAEHCRQLLARTDDDAARRRVLRDAVQYQSFRQSLTEAFR